MHKRQISRREFLRLGALTAAGAVLAGCKTPAPTSEPAKETVAVPPKEETQPTAVPASKYSEAPMLAGMGLPPVDERLPEEPMVIQPVDSLGEYGGTWHRAFLGVADFHALGRLIYDAVLRWPRDPKDAIQPGLATS